MTEEEYYEKYSDYDKEPNFLMQIWLSIAQTFYWMWQDLKPSKKVVVYGEVKPKKPNIFIRLWDFIIDPFRQMKSDLKSNSKEKISLHDWLIYTGRETVDNITNDLKFKKHETLSQMVSLALIVLIAIRIIVVWYTSGRPGADPFYLFRHGIFSIVWGLLLYFFYNLYLLRKTVSPLIQNLRDMERASFLAFLACLLKFGTSAYFIFVTRLAHLALNAVTIYYVGELSIWLLLALFMFVFWRNRREIRKKTQMENFE